MASGCYGCSWNWKYRKIRILKRVLVYSPFYPKKTSKIRKKARMRIHMLSVNLPYYEKGMSAHRNARAIHQQSSLYGMNGILPTPRNSERDQIKTLTGTHTIGTENKYAVCLTSREKWEVKLSLPVSLVEENVSDSDDNRRTNYAKERKEEAISTSVAVSAELKIWE